MSGRGKLSTVPYAERVELNRMIRDNAGSAAIIKAYKRITGSSDLSAQNISSYKMGSTYAGWLRNQERISRMQERRHMAKELFEAGGEDLSMASNRAARTAVEHIEEVLDEFDPDTLRQILAEKPDKFFGLVDALAGLRKGDQAFAKLQMDFDRHKTAMKRLAEEAALSARQSGNTDLAHLADEMSRVLGV